MIKHKNTDAQTSEQQQQEHTQGVVRLQVLVGQFEETLDSFQRHFGLQDAVEHPGERVKRDDQLSHQSERGEHLQEKTPTIVNTASELHLIHD